MEKQSVLTDAQKIDAIAWAANHSGLTYGRYTAQLSGIDKEMIYQQYADVLRERKAAEQRRLAPARRRLQGKNAKDSPAYKARRQDG